MKTRIPAAALPLLIAPAALAQFTAPQCEIAAIAGDDSNLPENFGWAISELADADGDGAMDLVIGAPFATGADGNPNGGRLELRSGATGALVYVWRGLKDESLGWSMADAGDCDGNGLNDIAAGAVGSAMTPAYVNVYSAEDGSLHLRIDSPGELGDFFGYAVATAFDVNNDGFDDILVGASGSDAIATDAGRAYVYSGADGALLRTYDPPTASAFAYFGSSCSRIDDVDGDGRGEHLVGAPGAAQAYMFSGATGALLRTFSASPGAGAFTDFFLGGLSDIDHDGTPDVYAGDYAHNGGNGRAYVYSGADASIIHAFDGAQGEGLGCGRYAGDVDNDGTDDIIVGGYTFPNNTPFGGRITIYSGADGRIIRRIESSLIGLTLGFDAVGMGDLDGDGMTDLAAAGANRRRVYIIPGREPCAGDATRDGRVDFSDVNTVLSAFGESGAAILGDDDNDMDVDFDDLNAVLANYGSPCGCD